MEPRTVLMFVAAALAVLGSGCGARSSAAAEAPGTKSYYSEKYHYRIAYPAEVHIEWKREEAPREGEGFTMWNGRDALRGSVFGEVNEKGVKAAARCAQRIGEWGKETPFRASYKVLKETWFVFSGIYGDQVIYEKGLLSGSAVKTFSVSYPAAAKTFFDPIVARMAAAFENYEVFSGKVLVNVPGEPGEGGSIWFAPKEGEGVNERTICYYGRGEAERFEGLKEKERITVGGVPDDVTIRDSSEQFAGLYEHRIRRCVIER